MGHMLARMAGLGAMLAASAAAAQPPVASRFVLRQAIAPAPLAAPEMRFKFETTRVDYSEPARPERRQGFLAAMQVMPGGFLGVGLSDKRPRKSAMGPDPARDGRRGGKKLALKFSLDF
jgi:hypothetical protein